MSLQVDYDQIRRYVARFIGAGRSSSNWSAEHQQDIDDALASGLRAFYWPTLADGTRYTWSFLQADGKVLIPANQDAAELPPDFSGLTQAFVAGQRLSLVAEERLRTIADAESKVGDPLYCAVRSADAKSAVGDRSSDVLIVFPTPEKATQVTFRYATEPEKLSSENPFPLGGVLHGETILEACLAAAEKILNPEAGEALHAKKFAECLAASVDSDRQRSGDSIEETVWPLDGIDGSTGTLEVNRSQLMRLVGRVMGIGTNPDSWTHGNKVEVHEVVRAGLRRFYHPIAIPGDKVPHQWSFLEPVASLQLSAGDGIYDLPGDFAVLRGHITYVPEHSSLYPPITRISEQSLRLKQQRTQTTGRPQCFAIRTKDTDATAGTRHELLVWPQPDQDYDVHYRYAINPDQLVDDAALPLGGQPHAQTLIAACMAAADEFQQENRGHESRFQSHLISSVGFDRQQDAPDQMQYNHDRSDWNDQGDSLDWHGFDENIVTYNGQTYW
ncbi:MAG: hypothetical protein AAGB04_00095 [Pseudomonadota bacterium]